MLDFFTENKWLIGGLATGSVVMFLGTLIALPIIVIKLPARYFHADHREHARVRDYHPLIFGLVIGLKNLLGAIFIVFGVVMLITPGQGLLSIVIGLTMMNYPGKYRFERWLVSRKPISRTLNWIRKKAHVAPLEPIDGEAVVTSDR